MPSTSLTLLSQVNYKKLASLLGMENPVSASNAWSRIKKKLAAQASDVATAGDGGEGVDSPMKATPKKRTPKHKKAAAAKDGEDGNDEEGNGSPSKKTKTPKSGGKGKKVKEEVVEEGNVTDGEVKMEEGEDSAFV